MNNSPDIPRVNQRNFMSLKYDTFSWITGRIVEWKIIVRCPFLNWTHYVAVTFVTNIICRHNWWTTSFESVFDDFKARVFVLKNDGQQFLTPRILSYGQNQLLDHFGHIKVISLKSIRCYPLPIFSRILWSVRNDHESFQLKLFITNYIQTMQFECTNS